MNQNLAKKGANKKDNFSHFAKHRFIKKDRFVAICFFFVLFNLLFLKLKTLMLNKKHNFKSGKSKDKKKGFETEKQDRKPKERKNISGKKEIAIENVHVVLFMKQKQRRKKNEKETKTRNKKKAKKKDKKEERKTRERERQRKRNRKRGRPKKVKGERKRNIENKQKMPFSRGKTGLLSIKKQRKQSKEKNKNQRKQKENKEGLGPSEVALWATSPDP